MYYIADRQAKQNVTKVFIICYFYLFEIIIDLQHFSFLFPPSQPSCTLFAKIVVTCMYLYILMCIFILEYNLLSLYNALKLMFLDRKKKRLEGLNPIQRTTRIYKIILFVLFMFIC